MKLHVDLKENGYDIYMEKGILYRLNDHIQLNRKVMIITDTGLFGEIFAGYQQIGIHIIRA